MPYAALVYKVFIASPSDVPKERQIIREVLNDWNCIHAEERGKILMQIGWETHASPAMGERPQEVINRQVLRGCDLLVAVFWTRLGTPTSGATSGTVAEIDEHIAGKKPAMIYFSNAPVRLESVDQDQYQALRDFRKRCEGHGLVGSYDTLSAFKDQFSRHLALTVARDLASPSEQRAQQGQAHIPIRRGPSVVLPECARELLEEAAKDTTGFVLRIETMAGLEIQTNGRNFTQQGDPRSEARWDAALKELCIKRLVEDLGKGEVFRVTHLGYQAADVMIAGD